MQRHFYQKVNLFLLLILTPLLLVLSGCEERKKREKERADFIHEEIDLMETFTLNNLKNHTKKVTISPKKLTFHNSDKDITIINIFKNLNRKTSYQLDTLTQLQKRYSKTLFVVSLLINKELKTQRLLSLVQKNKLDHYIVKDIKDDTFKTTLYKSLSLDETTHLPLTIIYYNGEYVIHYEGAVPIEMLRHDIEQIIQK